MFPHPTSWNEDMITGVLSAILGLEDDNHTQGSALLEKIQEWQRK